MEIKVIPEYIPVWDATPIYAEGDRVLYHDIEYKLTKVKDPNTMKESLHFVPIGRRSESTML